MAMASRLVATLARQACKKSWRGDPVKLRSCHVLAMADEMFQPLQLPEAKVKLTGTFQLEGQMGDVIFVHLHPTDALWNGGACRNTSGFAATLPLERTYVSDRLSRVYPKVDRKSAVKSLDGDTELPAGQGLSQPPDLRFKRLNQTGLKQTTKAIILGSLLGDGHLRILKGENDARFAFRHARMHEEYFQWKAAAVKEISSKASLHFGLNNKFLFQSQALIALTKIHEVTHDKNHLLIRRTWLNHLTPESLAVWWCDSGSLVAGSRKGVICTDFFTEDRVQLLAKYLEVVWKVYTHVGPVRRVRDDREVKEVFYYRLWLRTEELKKFLRIILPHIPVASMLRKCLIVYNNDACQQSWISEMKAALPHFSTFIDEELTKVKKPRAVEDFVSHALLGATKKDT